MFTWCYAANSCVQCNVQACCVTFGNSNSSMTRVFRSKILRKCELHRLSVNRFFHPGKVQNMISKRGVKTWTGLSSHFRRSDRNGDGVLDKYELLNALSAFHIDITAEVWVDICRFSCVTVCQFSHRLPNSPTLRPHRQQRWVFWLNVWLPFYNHASKSQQISWAWLWIFHYGG